MNSDEIEYKIFGDDMQLISVVLDPEESVVAEAGAMLCMPEGIKMQSVFGDGSTQNQTIMDKMVGAGKRLIAGENLLMTLFTNISKHRNYVTFAAPYPGKILPIDLNTIGNKLICQKDAFLCAAKGVSIGIELTRKLGAGFFGGEGFILESLEGDGITFIHACGTLIKKELKAGEVLKIDTGSLVAMTKDIDYDIRCVGDIKTSLFSGEGMFLTVLKGPGTVWLQSLPFSKMANRILSRQAVTREDSSVNVSGLLGGIINGFQD
jgi:uncharacterized protein (TIGR00266 family)